MSKGDLTAHGCVSTQGKVSVKSTQGEMVPERGRIDCDV